MRNLAAAAAFALSAGLATTAHAQSSGPNQPQTDPTPAAATEPVAATPIETAASAEVAAAPVEEAVTEEDDAELAASGNDPADPWEGFNRSMFSFNEAVDKALLEPTAKGYRAVTPTFVRSGVRNFLANLKAPVIFTNDVLQAEPNRASATLGRFMINSTIGVVGLFDVAKEMGIEKHDEDFGQTLAKWGVGHGPYVVLPLLGPSSLRDGTGRAVDIAIDPITYADFKNDDTARALRTGADLLTQRTDAIEAIDSIRETSLDPYVSTRSAYFQARASAVRNGEDAEDGQDTAEDSPDSE